MADIVRYNYPMTIYSGPGSRRKLVETLNQTGLKKPMIITDRVVVGLPWFKGFTALFSEASMEVGIFSEIWGNPTTTQVEAGVKAYKAFGADSIIALGGGAAMDVAKVIALMINHPGHVFDYEDGKPDALPVDQPFPPTYAVPTTAGTGSEVGRSSVISDPETHVKKIVFDPKMLPLSAFLDAELTLGLPAGVTAATGVDALSHNVEAYVAKGSHPMADGIALEGIRLVAKNLVQTVAFAKEGQSAERTEDNPFPDASAEHLEARDKMLNASMMGAVAFQKGLGVTHSCAHALSGVCDLHHGLAIAIMMPIAMTFNAQAVPERLVDMAKAAGISEATADGFVAWLNKLNEDVGIPSKLSAVGVKEEHIEKLVEYAFTDGCHQLNPRPVTKEDFKALFEQAL